MAKSHLRWGGFRVKHCGEDTGKGEIVGFGWLCSPNRNADDDRRVQIFHTKGLGYTYREMP